MVYNLSEVYGVSPKPNKSYVDRSNLDSDIQYLIQTDVIPTVAGPTKMGKTWLIKKNLSNSVFLTIQYGWDYDKLYSEIIKLLGINQPELVEAERKETITNNLGASAGLKVTGPEGAANLGRAKTTEVIKRQRVIDDSTIGVKEISENLKATKRVLVLDDFHYLKATAQTKFSYDLKTFWENDCYPIVIGISSESNTLIRLNPEISGRVRELSITWRDSDLKEVLTTGAKYLNIDLADELQQRIIEDSFGSVSVLQNIIQQYLWKSGIRKSLIIHKCIQFDEVLYNRVIDSYVATFETKFKNFVLSVSQGVRSRNDSTGIYRYAVKSLFNATDDDLINGYAADKVYLDIKKMAGTNVNIIRSNFNKITTQIEKIQAKNSPKDIVISFDLNRKEFLLQDRSFLLYRKYRPDIDSVIDSKNIND